MLKTIKPLLGLLLLFGLSLLLIYGLIYQDIVRISWVETTRRKFLLYNGPIVDLFGDKKLEQTFTANYPGLSQIDILFKGNGSLGGQDVVFHLKDGCSADNEIVRLSTELPPVDGFIFQPFTFSPIDNSTGQAYCLVLRAPEARPANPVQLQLSTGDLYPYGQLLVHNPKVEIEPPAVTPVSPNGGNDKQFQYKIYLPVVMGQSQDEELQLEDIGFRLHYKGLLRPTVQVFVTRLIANKPYIWGQFWFYGGLVIVYAVLLLGLFYIARKTIQLDSKK
jgi:hypothetical protein